MQEILRTLDPALISFVEHLMKQAGIEYMVADQYISVMEGSIGAFPKRILVATNHAIEAHAILRENAIEA